MRYNEKRSLYESIMRDVAKTVKQHINEGNGESNLPYTRRVNYLLEHVDEIDPPLMNVIMMFCDLITEVTEEGTLEKHQVKHFCD